MRLFVRIAVHQRVSLPCRATDRNPSRIQAFLFSVMDIEDGCQVDTARVFAPADVVQPLCGMDSPCLECQRNEDVTLPRGFINSNGHTCVSRKGTVFLFQTGNKRYRTAGKQR